MLVQGMWNTDSPLLQILDKATVRILVETHDIKEISEFSDFDDEERKKLLKGKDMDKIMAAWNRYPEIAMTCQLGERNDEEMELKVTMQREEELENDLVISSCYPGEKQEFWWVIVGDKKNNKVLATKRTLIKGKTEFKVNFEYNDVEKVIVYALCDSYVGCDQVEEIAI